jgi:hypothetical protein
MYICRVWIGIMGSTGVSSMGKRYLLTYNQTINKVSLHRVACASNPDTRSIFSALLLAPPVRAESDEENEMKMNERRDQSVLGRGKANSGKQTQLKRSETKAPSEL